MRKRGRLFHSFSLFPYSSSRRTNGAALKLCQRAIRVTDSKHHVELPMYSCSNYKWALREISGEVKIFNAYKQLCILQYGT